MNIKYNILLVILWFGFSFSAHSQFKHEFSVSAAAGVSTLNYSTTQGKQQLNIGGLTGVEYMFFFSKNWGIATGAEFSVYNSIYKIDNLSYSKTELMDTENDLFDFYSTIENYQEKQNATMINIPLKLQYQSGSKHKLYASVGGKIGLPVNGQAKLSKARFINKGYYPALDNWLETQEFMGFGTFTNKKFKEDLTFKTAYLLSAEAGVKWRLSKKLVLYTGGYVDYGLNTIYENKAPKHYFDYDPLKGRNFRTNTIMNSYYTDKNGTKTTFNDNVKPIAFGIKVKLTFGLLAKPKAVKQDDVFSTEIPDQTSGDRDITKNSKTGDGNTNDIDDKKINAKSEADQNKDVKDGSSGTNDSEQGKLKAASKNNSGKVGGIGIIKDVEDLVEKEANKSKVGSEKPIIKLDKDGSKGNRLDPTKPKEFTPENREILECITDGYDINKANLSDVNQEKLNRVVAYLNKYPSIIINCEGNTCELGGVTLNYNLGMVRAAIVKEYLTQQGIDARRITIESKGKYNMKYKNTSEDNRKLNRRVEITIGN